MEYNLKFNISLDVPIEIKFIDLLTEIKKIYPDSVWSENHRRIYINNNYYNWIYIDPENYITRISWYPSINLCEEYNLFQSIYIMKILKTKILM